MAKTFWGNAAEIAVEVPLLIARLPILITADVVGPFLSERQAEKWAPVFVSLMKPLDSIVEAAGAFGDKHNTVITNAIINQIVGKAFGKILGFFSPRFV